MRRKKKLSAFMFMLAFAAGFVSLFAQGEKKTKVAVMPPSASGEAQGSTAQGLTSIIVTELSLSPNLQVTDRRDVEKVLKEQALSQSGYCEQSCQIEIGKILQSKWVVTGDLNKLGKLYILTLKVLNVETGQVEYQDNEEHKGELEELPKATRTLSARLRNFLEGGKKPPVTPPPLTKGEQGGFGTLKLTTTPPGATVILDAENKGRTPITLSLPIGKHDLTLSLSGYEDIPKVITIEKEKTLEITEEFSLQTGTISVTSTPSDASVYLDNSYQGKTPLELKRVSVGTHLVRLELSDYEPKEKSVDVKYKDKTDLNFSLAGLPGKLAVTSTPQGANVFVDAKSAGQTPLSGYAISPGTHTIKVSLLGYKTQTETIEILPNRGKTAAFTLESIKTAALTVTSFPENARVILNKTDRGKTPLTLSDLPPGKYQMIVKKEGYKEFWGEVTLSEGEEKEVPITLSEVPKQKEDIVFIPAPSGYVNDYADILDNATHNQITDIAKNLETKTSVELAVVAVKSVAPMALKDYAVELFKRWGIGKKGKDNGVLFIVATEDRRVEIEVGYGLESVLTDGKCGEILYTYVVPYFMEGNWGKGMLEGAKAIAKKVGSYQELWGQA